jgi:predicted nucleotidyltransferase
VRRPNRAELAALHAAHRPDTPLSFDDFARSQARKVNEGRYRGREYFVRFVKWPNEVEETYGDRHFRPLGRVTVRMRVTDDRDALFTPCRYPVARVTFLDGPPVDDLVEAISFRGRFSAQVQAGEWATARGSLERVIPQQGGHSGSVYHRLVIGGQAGDYLLAQHPEAT